MFKINANLAAAMLAALSTAIDGGKMHIFAGTVPASADDELDLVSEHTRVAIITVDGDGVTGLEWDVPTGNVLAKVPADVWRGVVALDGAAVGDTVAPTFFRIGEAADNCSDGYPGTPRLQGTVSGPSGGGDMLLGAATVTDNGTNTVTISIANLMLAG